MAVYRCLVADQDGRTSTRLVTASDEAEAARSIPSNVGFLIKVELAPTDRAARNPGRRSSKVVLEFTEMMELLLDSGLSLKDALEVASSIGKDAPTGALASRLLVEIRKGLSFSRAVEGASDVFPAIYRGMVKVGDRIGSVERIFPRLASYLRDRKALGDKVSGALAYPALILAVSVLGAIGLSVFVMPRMEAIFSGFGGDAADRVRSNLRAMKIIFTLVGCLVAAGVAASFAVSRLSRTNKSLAASVDRMVLFLPIVGRFVSSWQTLNFAFAMETLTAGGVAVEAAIEEAAAVTTNEAYRRALNAVRTEVMKGGSLAAAFAAHREFPPYMSQWLAVGERSGRTERVFSQIRRYFQAEVEQRSARFMALIEPSLIAAIGIVMLFMVTGVIVPLFSMYGSIL